MGGERKPSGRKTKLMVHAKRMLLREGWRAKWVNQMRAEFAKEVVVRRVQQILSADPQFEHKSRKRCTTSPKTTNSTSFLGVGRANENRPIYSTEKYSMKRRGSAYTGQMGGRH